MKELKIASTLMLVLPAIVMAPYAFAGGGAEPDPVATTSAMGGAAGTVNGLGNSAAAVGLAGIPMQAILVVLAAALVAALTVWAVRKQPAH